MLQPRAFLALKLAILGGVVVLVVILPRLMGEYRVGQFTFVAMYFIALVGLSVLTGSSGQISLGLGAFFGLGAYASAILTLGRPGLETLGTHPPGWLPIGHGMTATFTIPLAFVVTGLVGYAFGIPALRLAGVSLALATFAMAVSFPSVAKRFETVTGGGGGLSLNLPTTPFGLHISTPHWLYYQAWATAGILTLVAWLLLRGRAGRALAALRDGEAAAVSAGISPARYKTFAFGISSAFAGAAGALLAIQVAYVNPDTFPASLSILFLASLVLGGLGSIYGALLGALIMEFLPIYAQSPPFLSGSFSKQSPAVVFGVFLIVVMFLAPSGIMGLLRRLTRPMIASRNRTQIITGGRDAPDRRRAESS
jgi:branched-chain amino acid transport system permease protein